MSLKLLEVLVQHQVGETRREKKQPCSHLALSLRLWISSGAAHSNMKSHVNDRRISLWLWSLALLLEVFIELKRAKCLFTTATRGAMKHCLKNQFAISKFKRMDGLFAVVLSFSLSLSHSPLASVAMAYQWDKILSLLILFFFVPVYLVCIFLFAGSVLKSQLQVEHYWCWSEIEEKFLGFLSIIEEYKYELHSLLFCFGWHRETVLVQSLRYIRWNQK